jgi:DNA-binding response OmpR family regulator
MPAKILIIEDEPQLARFIELELTHEDYSVTKAYDGRDGLTLAESGDFDLVLLDIMLPGLNGIEVLRRLRKSSDVPVIMLTARDAIMDKVSGLDMGANDYITKPFAIEELLARIRAALRQNSHTISQIIQEEEVITCGALEINTSRHTVTYDGIPVELTNKEFILLQKLAENKSIVLSRDLLLEHVWGYDYAGETNVVDVYIRYLRSKIDDVFGVKLITTVRGVGYVIKEQV